MERQENNYKERKTIKGGQTKKDKKRKTRTKNKKGKTIKEIR